jgi:hypothetical protein
MQEIKTKGYYYDPIRNVYRVQLTIDGKRKTIGSYLTAEEARAIYLESKKKEKLRKKISESNERIIES